MDADDTTNDTTTGLQMQQFLDEWHHRVLHSGVALTQDQIATVTSALNIFEAAGVSMSAAEKQELAQAEEASLVDKIVEKMPQDLKRNFEHFSLQLQLVVSSVTLVRRMLEDGSREEMAYVMEEGDKGVTQHILKQAIYEAAEEVGELKELHESWTNAAGARMMRLQRCQQDADVAQRQLDELNAQLLSFGMEQNSKSQKVLMTMAGSSDKALLHACLTNWHVWQVKHRGERGLHDQFSKELEDAKQKLFEYKQAKSAGMKKVLLRSLNASDSSLQLEILREWTKFVAGEKEEKDLNFKLAKQQERINAMKSSQKDNAKRSMMRMADGNDGSLKIMCFKAWSGGMEEMKMQRAFDEQVAAQEARMKEYSEKNSGKSKDVITRMMGASATGLLFSTLQAWIEDFKSERKARELEDVMRAQQTKFANLNARQKANAAGSARRTTDLEDENLVTHVFMNWVTEAKLERVARYYSGKMDTKKQQLDAVQTMFKSFATQLEQGMSSTPRTTRKSNRSSSRTAAPADGRPPLPAGAAA